MRKVTDRNREYYLKSVPNRRIVREAEIFLGFTKPYSMFITQDNISFVTKGHFNSQHKSKIEEFDHSDLVDYGDKKGVKSKFIEFKDNPTYEFLYKDLGDDVSRNLESILRSNRYIIEQEERHEQNLKDGLLDEQGNLLGIYEKRFRRYQLGSVDVAGWTYRESALNEVKKIQFQEKKDSTLEQATIEAERDNEFDRKAIKVLVSERHIGYIPKRSAFKDKLNKLIDMGYEKKVTGYVNYTYDYNLKERMVDVQLYVNEKR